MVFFGGEGLKILQKKKHLCKIFICVSYFSILEFYLYSS